MAGEQGAPEMRSRSVFRMHFILSSVNGGTQVPVMEQGSAGTSPNPVVGQMFETMVNCVT